MWQKGPGEGYHASKDENGKVIGKSPNQARDAWANAFFNLGGKYLQNRAGLKGLAYRPFLTSSGGT